MTEKIPILVVDDERQMRRLLQIALESAGYAVILAETGEQALQFAVKVNPDAIILDLGLPDKDGIEVLRRLREWATVPVIVLSVRSSEQDIVAALDAGADDYLTKPFRTGELLARVRTALRHRHGIEEESVFVSGPISVDLAARTVRRNGEVVRLTPKEYALLALFIRNAGKVLTHQYILQQIWGPALDGETQYSRVYVGQLRKKLEEDPEQPRLLQTESGIGYRLSTED
ncbi:MAG TPA: response regulator [Bacteroidota bacterium]|nr:response regulator [Bacteroidota bacterium]